MLKADAMTIGNHEFDHDIEGVVPFLENIESPVVISNVDDSEEPTFQGKYVKSIVIDKYERKVGVIGAILRSTSTIAKSGNKNKLKIKLLIVHNFSIISTFSNSDQKIHSTIPFIFKVNCDF